MTLYFFHVHIHLTLTSSTAQRHIQHNWILVHSLCNWHHPQRIALVEVKTWIKKKNKEREKAELQLSWISSCSTHKFAPCAAAFATCNTYQVYTKPFNHLITHSTLVWFWCQSLYFNVKQITVDSLLTTSGYCIDSNGVIHIDWLVSNNNMEYLIRRIVYLIWVGEESLSSHKEDDPPQAELVVRSSYCY